MKYIVILGDGMADDPLEQLGGKTPLQAAVKPTIDQLARYGEIGMVRTIPEGMPPGSDTANLAVMGYNPRQYYTGRSPFEAISMGVPLAESDITFRCNLVTLSDAPCYAERTMLDHSADEITSAEAGELIAAVDAALHTEAITFHQGVSYRHLMVWHAGPNEFELTPPHDILGRGIASYLPKGPHGGTIRALMERSPEILMVHPMNQARVARGLKPANSIWIWGEGKKPALPSFREKYGLDGTVISAVDLVKGIGLCAGLRAVEVPGATGTLHTNFRGKAMAAVEALRAGQQFVYVHLEAPDECGHRFEIENKVRAIELIDAEVVRVIVEEMEQWGEPFRMLILPDHPTPLRLRTHTADPVPFLIYQSQPRWAPRAQRYDEESARQSGLSIVAGHTLMDRFLLG